MTGVPSNLIPSTIPQLPEIFSPSDLGYLPYSYGGRTYKVSLVNALSGGGGVPSTRQVIAGTGLSGGGALSSNVTLNVVFSDTAPAVGSASGVAGVATTTSRSDHQHPAVNLDAAAEVTGTLAVANGGTNASTAAAARTNLGATTVGGNFYTLGNPTAITFIRVNADNTVSTLNASDFRTAIGAGSGSGSVSSVSGTGSVNGITLSGTVTSAGDLTLSGTLSGVSLTTQVTGTLPIANGGTNATSAGAARTNLGGTTVGSAVFTVTNPSAITFFRVNADNSVTLLDAASFRTAIGAGVGGGSVTSVSGTGSVNGITLSGTVTSAGNVTLGGALTGVSLTTQVTGTLPIANGGTNATTAATARTNLGSTTVGDAVFIAASAAAARTALALGTAAVENIGTSGANVPLLTGLNTHTSVRSLIASTSGTAIDWATGDYHTRAVTTPTTFTFSNVASGPVLGIVLKVVMTGSQALTWPASVNWPGGTVPTLASGKVHLFTFISDDGGTVVHASSLIDYAA